MKRETDYDLGPQMTAVALGSGDLPVLGTPAIVALVENCCLELAKDLQTAGETSVGIELTISHLKASNSQGRLKVNVQLSEQTKQLLTFEFTVFKSGSLVAKGRHRRAIVDRERFMRKME